MKQFFAREMLWLCAPILFLAAGVGVSRVLYPPKDPNAKIQLKLSFPPPRKDIVSHEPRLHFSRKVEAIGGPKDGYNIGYREQIVAISRSGETLLWSAPSTRGLGKDVSTFSGTGHTPRVGSHISTDFSIGASQVPLDTQKIEWRGDFVAQPREEGSVSAAATTTQLDEWAQTRGAARSRKTVSLPFDANKNAIPVCELQPLDAANAASGADVCVSLEIRGAGSFRAQRRLVAFDGKTRRVLWHDYSRGDNPYWSGQKTTGFGAIEMETYWFDLEKAPRSWGEIVFLLDVVYPKDQKSDYLGNVASWRLLQKLKKAGNLHFSRRVVVRKSDKKELRRQKLK